MPITSYAQNFEDVILWRAVGDTSSGIYIDIGAQDPVQDSVSKAFYDRGWRGIHVEPVKAYANAIRLHRPDEIVIEAALSAQSGPITLFEVPGTGLSTVHRDIALMHESALDVVLVEHIVQTLTLDDLLDQYIEGDVQWLKLDVEGHERSVLESWARSSIRPWILLIEATYPNSPQDTSGEWEYLVKNKGYALVYEDGLNRYYLSAERMELADRFRFPPNYFDRFQLAGGWQTINLRANYDGYIHHLTNQVLPLERKRSKARERQLKSKLSNLERKLDRRKTLQEPDTSSPSFSLEPGEYPAVNAQQNMPLRAQEDAPSNEPYVGAPVPLTDGGLFPSPFSRKPLNHGSAERSPQGKMPAKSVMTVHELLSISDDSFIDALYWTILGREVDEKGREHHWRRLARGDLRADIIYDLFKSKESQRRKSHRDLFALPDEAFVKAAYRRLLGREADPEGLQSYCDLLKRRGRARVLKDIKSTAEFQNARVYWPYTDVRLKAFIRKQRVQRLVRRLAPGAENTGKVLRQINFNVRHDLKALDAVVMSLRQDVASLGIQTRDLRRAMQRRDVRHAPAPSRPWLQPSFEQAAPKAVINSTFEALQRRMAREISHGVFSNQLVGQAKIDDFLSGAGPIEASPEGAIRWVNSLAIASLKVTGPSMHVIAAGVFERRAVQFSVNGEYLGEFVFEPGKTNVTISVEEWKGEDIALGIQPLGLFAPRSRGVSADHRELGLLLHSIYFN